MPFYPFTMEVMNAGLDRIHRLVSKLQEEAE
jgi:hypothetical protein